MIDVLKVTVDEAMEDLAKSSGHTYCKTHKNLYNSSGLIVGVVKNVYRQDLFQIFRNLSLNYKYNTTRDFVECNNFMFKFDCKGELEQEVIKVDASVMQFTEIKYNEPKCECGAKAIGSKFHSEWCPLK